MASLQQIGAVTAVPALAMVLGSAAIAVGGEPSERMQTRLQQFSGGLLIGAVITDIFPILRSHLAVHHGFNFLAGIAGFGGALLLMYGVRSLGLEELSLEEGASAVGHDRVGDGDEDSDEGEGRRAEPWWGRVVEPLAGLAARATAVVRGRGTAGAAAQQPLLQQPNSPDTMLAAALVANAGRAASPRGGVAIDGPRKGLQLAVARLTERAAVLGQLATAEDVDREAVDEEVHSLDFLMDVARRRCQSDETEPLDAGSTARLRFHVAGLAEEVSHARSMDAHDLPGLDAQLRVIAGKLRRIHDHAEQRGIAFRRWGPRMNSLPESAAAAALAGTSQAPAAALVGASSVTPMNSAALGEAMAPPTAAEGSGEVAGAAAMAMPWGLVLAVLIDSVVDGMLIGLAGSVALESGWLMAMATAIEMGFLGYSFACAVAGPAMARGGRLLRAAVLGLPPTAMLLASMAASTGAARVEGQPTFVGLVAFSLAAVLFLVVEELLLEAHEKEGADEWHISVWLYVGLLLSICLDVAA